MRIAFTGGGTGGHVFPGLSIIERLKDRGITDIHWIGTKNGVEQDLAAQAGIPFHGISTGKLRRYFSLKNMADFFRFIKGLVQARFLLARLKPDLVFSKGGFAAVPAVWAAGKKTPVWIHESDRDPGLATRLSMKKAAKIFVAYPETAEAFPAALRARIVVSGNPVRKAFYAARPEAGRAFAGLTGTKPLIFAVGGSSGAKQINDLILALLPGILEKADIIHQTGVAGEEGPKHSGYVPKAFIREEYPDVLAAADIVVSRAGAGSLWEFAVTGKASILIPLGSKTSRGDQILNARYFQDRGAALVAESDNPSPDELKTLIERLLNDAGERKKIARAAAALASQDAAAVIASAIAEGGKTV